MTFSIGFVCGWFALFLIRVVLYKLNKIAENGRSNR